MIVTKQRRHSQYNSQSGQNYNYHNSLFQQDKENHFKSTNQSKTRIVDKQPLCYNRERNFTYGSLSKTNKKNNNYFTPYQSCKKIQKKYDYSVVFGQQQQHEKQVSYSYINQTHSKYNSRFSQDKHNNSNDNNKEQQSQLLSSFIIMDDGKIDRKRCSSSVVKTSIPKYNKYSENNYMLIQQKQVQSNSKSNGKLTTTSYQNNRDGNKSSQVNQKSSGHKKTTTTTACNLLLATKPSRYDNYHQLNTNNKENRTSNIKAFFANDNFNYDNKFIQSKTHQKLTNSNTNTNSLPIHSSPINSTNKYQQKYSQIRKSSNNRRSQIINKSYQYLQNQLSKTHQQQYQHKPTITIIDNNKPMVDFQQLYKNSQIYNKKLNEKINRITELNGEINRRLQKMLLPQNLH